MQVTIPEEVRKAYPIKAGTQLSWSVEGNALVARRVRGPSELAGCLKSEVPFPGIQPEKKAVAALRSEHHIKKRSQA